MDQMASSLGDEQALMAMSCQPAEVEPEVPIPTHLKFWGLDSGQPFFVYVRDVHSSQMQPSLALLINAHGAPHPFALLFSLQTTDLIFAATSARPIKGLVHTMRLP